MMRSEEKPSMERGRGRTERGETKRWRKRRNLVEARAISPRNEERED